jgi:hypothetical protein
VPDFGDRVEIDGHEIYGGPKGSEIPDPLLWSPDGRQLAFIETHGDSRDLLIAPTASAPGAALRRFPLAAVKPELLAWSDDGAALLGRSGQDYVRLDATAGTSEHIAASDLASRGFARYAAAATATARAEQMGGRASSWWTPPGAAETAKGKAP